MSDLVGWGIIFIIVAVSIGGALLIARHDGRTAQRNKELEDERESLEIAKRAEDSVTALSPSAQRDKLFGKYSRVLPDRKADPR